MGERYFSDQPISGTLAVLSGAEAQHLKRVMRVQVGDQVTLFDGSGAEFDAVVRAIGRTEVEVEVVGRREVCREAANSVVLAVALPKGDRQRWLVEKLTEVGVARLVPVETARSVARPTTATLAKLRRAVVEASKQCGRNQLMEVAEPTAWATMVNDVEGDQRVVAHPADAAAVRIDPGVSTAIAIGPEGA